jgi:glycosyltransferase involved in cell wall biosynthesis
MVEIPKTWKPQFKGVHPENFSVTDSVGDPLMLKSTLPFTLVIPAYNEVERIAPTLKGLMNTLDFRFKKKYELLVVIDGSNDGTTETVKRLINNHSGATAIVFPNRLGKGGAIIEALKYARGDFIAFVDADGAVPPWELNRLTELANDYDLIMGSRYEKDSILTKGRPIGRVILSRSFNVLVKLLFWRLRGIRDTQCGVKIFTRKLVNDIQEDLFVTDFAFDVNFIYSALRRGFKVKEVGITWTEKDGSKLSIGIIKQSLAMFFSLLRLRIYYQFKGTSFLKKVIDELARPIYLWVQT